MIAIEGSLLHLVDLRSRAADFEPLIRDRMLAGVLSGVAERNFLVCGHTDNVPVGRGNRFKSNWDLSTARAVTVTKLLLEEGVPAARLAAAGFADGDPVADNGSKDGRQKNRRTEIVLMPNIEELPVVPEGL